MLVAPASQLIFLKRKHGDFGLSQQSLYSCVSPLFQYVSILFIYACTVNEQMKLFAPSCSIKLLRIFRIVLTKLTTYRYVGTGWPWAIHGSVVWPFNTTCRNECFSTFIRGCTNPFGSVTIIRPGYVDIWISPEVKISEEWERIKINIE